MASTPDTVVVYMKRVAGGFEETTATLAEIGVSPEVHDGILARIAKLQKLYGVPDRVFKGVAYTPGLTSDYDNFTKRLTFSTNGLGGTWKAAEQAMTDRGYSVNVGDRGLSSLIDHEYAHAVDAHIKQSLDDDGFAAWKAAKEGLRKRLGDPSEYSKTNLGEWFAERFALEQGGGTDQRTLLVEGVGRFREDYLGDKGMRERLAAAKPPAGRSPAPVTQTINEAYRDAALRHQIDLRRYSAGVTKRVARLLEEADRDLTERLRTRLARFEGRDLDFTGERWKALLTDIRGARAAALSEYKTLVRDELGPLAVLEGQAEIDLLQSSITIEVGFMAVNADQLRAIATSRPFQGRLLNDWFKTLEQVDQQRLVQAIQLGMVQGEPIDDIVRRVVGTRKNNYADGILSMTRRDAQAIVRTAVNHVSNTARGYVWDANSDIITARIWVSTLDGRTSAVCRSRDGKGAPVGDNPLPEGVEPLVPADAKPPAHINCRSVMVAYIDGVGLLGNRPTVTDTRTRKARETDFRAEAKARGVPIQQIRKEWAEKNVGRVPAATNYQDFLSRQTASFQDDVLGKTKGELFRKGGLTVDQFVDRNGTELTLSQLAKKHPEAFQRAFGNEGGKLSLSDGTPVGDWHAASFAEAPDWLQSKVRTHSIPGVTSDTPDQAYFSPSSKKIEMDGRTTTDPGHQAVWRHEVGHAMDYALREGGNVYRSQSLDYTAAQIKDKDELLKIKKALDKAGSPPLPAGVPSPEDLSKQFAKAGINEAELEEFFRAHTFVGDLQGIGLRARKAQMLQAWNNKDIQEFVDALILSGGPDRGYSKGVLGNITDLTGATTRNELCSYNKGYYGHSPEYYKRARAWGGYEGTEAFANLTALAGAKEPFAWKIAQRFFPEQVRVYLEIMK